MKNSDQLNISIDPDLKKEVYERAEELDVPISSFVRNALRKKLGDKTERENS